MSEHEEEKTERGGTAAGDVKESERAQ